MSQTTNLVSIEFLSWIRDKMKEEAERREPRSDKRKAARMRQAAFMGMSMVAMLFSSIL